MLAHGKLNREEEVCAALRENEVEPVSLFAMLTELSSGNFATLPNLLPKLSGNRSYRLEDDATYFAYLAHAFAERTGGKP